MSLENAIDLTRRAIDTSTDSIRLANDPLGRRGYVGGTRLDGSNGHGGYAFGPFVVDSVKRQLWRDRRLVPITSKTFDVLVALLEHRDHIVSKDELLNRVWPDTAVNENNLARQVSSLRRALGQRPDQHDFVVTIPGHGYRFVATVQDLSECDRSYRRPSHARGRPRYPLDVAPEPALDLDDHRAADELRQVSPSHESAQTTAIRVHRPDRAAVDGRRNTRGHELRAPGDGRRRDAAAARESESATSTNAAAHHL